MNRQDFPIFKNHSKLIYFDSAASSHKPQSVLDSIMDFYTKGYSNVHRGNYTLSEYATDLFEAARKDVATFIGADHEEIIFTSGTTDSINKLAASLKPLIGNTAIVTTVMEHHSNFLPWQQLARQNESLFRIVNIDDNFRLKLNELYDYVESDRPRVIALTQMSNVTGTINPIKEIIAKIRQINPETIIVVDAAQSVPHMKVDVKDLDCDALAFSGHKIFAPTGIGVLFVKKSLLTKLTPTVFGGGMINKVERLNASWANHPTSFEAGTPNIEGVVGLQAAIKYVESIGFEYILKHENELSKYFVDKIAKIDGIKIFGPINMADRGPVFSFAVNNIHPHDLATMLNEYNIAVRAGHHCAQILHREIFKVAASTRVSLSVYNTKDEIDALADAIINIKKRFKR